MQASANTTAPEPKTRIVFIIFCSLQNGPYFAEALAEAATTFDAAVLAS